MKKIKSFVVRRKWNLLFTKSRFINTVRQSSLLGANKPLYLSRVHRHSNHEVRTVVCKVCGLEKPLLDMREGQKLLQFCMHKNNRASFWTFSEYHFQSFVLPWGYFAVLCTFDICLQYTEEIYWPTTNKEMYLPRGSRIYKRQCLANKVLRR